MLIFTFLSTLLKYMVVVALWSRPSACEHLLLVCVNLKVIFCVVTELFFLGNVRDSEPESPPPFPPGTDALVPDTWADPNSDSNTSADPNTSSVLR